MIKQLIILAIILFIMMLNNAKNVQVKIYVLYAKKILHLLMVINHYALKKRN